MSRGPCIDAWMYRGPMRTVGCVMAYPVALHHATQEGLGFRVQGLGFRV